MKKKRGKMKNIKKTKKKIKKTKQKKTKKKTKKQFEKSTGKVRETRLRMRASKGSTLPTFCTITIVRKKRGKYAHAHTITSGSTTANVVLFVPIYY